MMSLTNVSMLQLSALKLFDVLHRWYSHLTCVSPFHYLRGCWVVKKRILWARASPTPHNIPHLLLPNATPMPFLRSSFSLFPSSFLHIPSLPERGIDRFSAYVGDRESVVRTPPKNHMSINLLIDKNGVIITLSRGPRAAAAHKANNNNPARGHHQHRAFFPPTGQLIAKVSPVSPFFIPDLYLPLQHL